MTRVLQDPTDDNAEKKRIMWRQRETAAKASCDSFMNARPVTSRITSLDDNELQTFGLGDIECRILKGGDVIVSIIDMTCLTVGTIQKTLLKCLLA